jgi:ribosomal protein S18 acetylase RimI-like enzyme
VPLPLSIQRADHSDLDRLATLLGDAFMDDPISTWLFPDRIEREKYNAPFFQVFVEMFLAHGHVFRTADFAGLTMWLDVSPDDPADDDDSFGRQMAEAVGEHAERFAVLDGLMSAGHPHHEAHAYLPFIAVAPERQGHGVGEALLRHRLAELDAAGRPAYLEASCLRNAALYSRVGFERMEQTIDLPDGPSLYPMWRPAQR